MEQQKRPGVAFALSLLYPGLGHFYCKKQQQGLITAAFFTGCMLVLFFVDPNSSPLFWGMALRAAIVLYGFGFLDAFYSAREINVGIDQYMIGSNPRIAAMLNLLTAGFGYFYLGERTKGLIWFFASRILFAGGATRVSWVALIVEFACIVVAVDAFRIASRKLRETFSAESTDPFATSEKGLSPLVPMALGAILVLNYFAVVALGLMMPKYSVEERSPLSVISLPDGQSTIEQQAYGVRMRLPAGWKPNTTSKEFVLGASYEEFGCQVGLMMHSNLSLRGRDGLARQMEAEVKKAIPTYQWLSEGPTAIGTKPAYVLKFQAKYKNIPVVEKIIFLQHGLTLYSFIEAASVGTAGECGPMMDQILSTVQLNY